jgi:hypothetical protein
MGLKNIRLLGPQVLGDLVLDLKDLQPGLHERLFKAVNFRRHFFGGYFATGDDMPGAMQDKNFPATYTRRNGYAAKHFFSL